MISVVISTYNGSRFIIEQLDSIRMQTILPDEVIICDDCSTDNTENIIIRYIQKYNLSTWYFEKNPINIGWKSNFQKLIKKAKGDIIFLCDQDDIWELDKISEMTDILRSNDEIMLLASNYTPFYDNYGQKLRLHKSEKSNTKEVYRLANTKSFFNVLRPGCVYGVKQELVKYLEKYANNDDEHDAFLWRIASILGSLYIYDRTTIQFRRHSNNATRKAKVTKDSKTKRILNDFEKIERMNQFCKDNRQIIDKDASKKMNQYNKWINLRMMLVKKRDIISYLKLIQYVKCYYSLKTYIADFYFFILKA